MSADEEIFQDVLDALETDSHQVANLARNRAWLSLEGHLLRKREVERKRLITAMLRPRAEPVDQRAVDYLRGMIETIDFILVLPERMKPKGDQTGAE